MSGLCSIISQREAIAGVKEEVSVLKRVNEDLLKQIETLQKQRFGMVEELVYQKWLNSCLRFEIQDYRTPLRTPRRDPGKDWSFGSQQEAKSTGGAVSDSPDSSQTSMESREFDDTSSTLESSSSSQSSISKRSSRITKIKKWNKSKRDITVDPSADRSPSKSFLGKTGLIRRFSTSMVPEGLSKVRTNGHWNVGVAIDASRKTSKKDLAGSPGPEIHSRRRRVSFNDRVSVRNLEPAFEDASTPVETEPFSQEKCDRTSSRTSTTEARDDALTATSKEKVRKHQDMTALEATDSSHWCANELERNETNERAVDKIGAARSEEARHGQIEAGSLGLVSAFIIFIFILLLVSRFCSWLYCNMS